jgi:hypothetical protein
LKRPSSPSGERVPSGKIMSDSPAAKVASASASIARTLAPWPRTTGRSPPSFISQPMTGARNSDALAIQRMSQRRPDRSHGSAVDWWLATTT